MFRYNIFYLFITLNAKNDKIFEAIVLFKYEGDTDRKIYYLFYSK